LSDDHSLIDLGSRHHEQLAAFLEIPKSVRHRLTIASRDQNTVRASHNRSFVWRKIVKHPVHHACTARVGQKFAVITDETTRWRKEDEARLAGAGRPHVLQFAFSGADFLDYDT